MIIHYTNQYKYSELRVKQTNSASPEQFLYPSLSVA